MNFQYFQANTISVTQAEIFFVNVKFNFSLLKIKRLQILKNKNIEFQTIGELFCGPLGGGLGASMSILDLNNKIIRLRHLWATDYDKDSCATYKQPVGYIFGRRVQKTSVLISKNYLLI